MIPVRRALRVAALATLLAAFPAAGEVYRWTDAQGRLHFTEQLAKVPPAHRAEARRNAAAGAGNRLHSYTGSVETSPSQTSSSRTRAMRTRARSGTIQIPFVRDGSLMRVDAVLNDLVHVPFLVDTGASGVSIPSSFAEKLGVRIRPDTPLVEVHTANGVIARPMITLQSVQVGEARVENLSATVNPAMDIGLLGGEFFNNFIYRVDAAQNLMTMIPNENIRGGLGPEQWRQRFGALMDPLSRLDAHLQDNPELNQNERAELAARRAELESSLAELEREADRLDVPQIWRY